MGAFSYHGSLLPYVGQRFELVPGTSVRVEGEWRSNYRRIDDTPILLTTVRASSMTPLTQLNMVCVRCGDDHTRGLYSDYCLPCDEANEQDRYELTQEQAL